MTRAYIDGWHQTFKRELDCLDAVSMRLVSNGMVSFYYTMVQGLLQHSSGLLHQMGFEPRKTTPARLSLSVPCFAGPLSGPAAFDRRRAQ